MRRTCWSSVTSYRVWKSSIGPTLLRPSKCCRSVLVLISVPLVHRGELTEYDSFMTNCLSWFRFYYFFPCSILVVLQDFRSKYRLSTQPQSISIDCFFLNKLSLKTSTFDSPKKEKRPPRKWRAKNYNKEVKTTLQVCGETTDISETVPACV